MALRRWTEALRKGGREGVSKVVVVVEVVVVVVVVVGKESYKI